MEMIQKLCDYGCGMPATYNFKSSTMFRKTGGSWCCSPSKNSCPAMKQKNKDAQPYSDPVQKAFIVEKISQTLLKNHGVTNVSKSPLIKLKKSKTHSETMSDPVKRKAISEKNMATTRANHGVNYALQSPLIKAKVIATNLLNNGAEWAQQSPKVREKTIKNNLINGALNTLWFLNKQKLK